MDGLCKLGDEIMNKKIVIMIVLSIFCLSCSGISVFANDDTDYRELESLFNGEECDLINDIIDNSSLFEGGIAANTNTYSINNSSDNTVYKQYSLYADELITADANGEKLSNYLSDTYCWIVEKSGCFVKVVFKDGQWEAIGYATYTQDSDTDIIDTSEFEQKLSILQSKNEGVDIDTAFFNIAAYKTSFAYISAGENEYLIPYGSRPDFTGMENGKVYTVAQIASKLTALSEGNDVNSDMNAGGFASASDADSNNNIKYVIVTVGIGIVFLFIMFIFIRKRKGKSI